MFLNPWKTNFQEKIAYAPRKEENSVNKTTQ